MRRFLFALLLMSLAVLSAVPVAAADVPPICTPDPRVTLDQSSGQSWLYFEPRIHILCQPWDGPHMDNAAELYAVQMVVIRSQVLEVGSTPTVLFDELLNATEISNVGGTFLNLDGGINITGKTTPNYHYRLIVHISGHISHDPGYGGGTGSTDDAFGATYYSDWLQGPDNYEVNGPFRERPDELKGHQRPTHGQVSGLQSN